MIFSDLLDSLAQQLPLCLSLDRHPLTRQLESLRQRARQGKLPEESLRVVQERIAHSVAARARRLASIPVLNFPDLPVTARRTEIAALIEQHQVLVMCGETGSGKTTQLPKICLSIGRGAAGLIGHTQPRRIAARTVADRIAEELGEKIGQAVGY